MLRPGGQVAPRPGYGHTSPPPGSGPAPAGHTAPDQPVPGRATPQTTTGHGAPRSRWARSLSPWETGPPRFTKDSAAESARLSSDVAMAGIRLP